MLRLLHMRENFERIAAGTDPKEWIRENPCTLVLKGSHSQILQGQQEMYCLGGSSVLARGGSGDILTGIMATLLAKKTYSLMDAACLAVQWHGRAAEVLARQHGQEAILATEILNYLSLRYGMISKNKQSPSLLVLAAGLGSRYGGLKQLERIGPSGETLMDYSIYDAYKAGFTRVVFLIREEMHRQFEEQVGNKYKEKIEVDYAYQNKKIFLLDLFALKRENDLGARGMRYGRQGCP